MPDKDLLEKLKAQYENAGMTPTQAATAAQSTLNQTQQEVQKKNEALVGSIQEVLIEGKHHRKENTATGRTRGNHHVSIINSATKVGDILAVRITGAQPSSLEAEPISTSKDSG